MASFPHGNGRPFTPEHFKGPRRGLHALQRQHHHIVHRAAFLDEMLKLLPGGTGEGLVTFNKRCTGIEEVRDGGLTIHFADGTTRTADAVIGCVRQILLRGQPNIEPEFTGKYAYHGLIPMEDAVAAIGERARDNLMFWGYGGHLVTFPIDKGKTFDVVAFQTPKTAKWEHGNDWVVSITIADVLDDFKDWSEPVKKLLSMLKKRDKWGLFDHPPARTYCGGRKICLLGDCAHASTPHQDAGAGMAIEDAAVLATLLAQIEEPDPTVLEKVFTAYDAVRRPRTQRLVTTSRAAGLLYGLQLPGVEDAWTKCTTSVRIGIDGYGSTTLNSTAEMPLNSCSLRVSNQRRSSCVSYC